MAFVKLDTGILHSTLWMDRTAREVFITALLMAEPREFTEPQRQLAVRTIEETGFEAPPGWYGFVQAAGAGIIRQAGLDPEEGFAALERLCAEDPESRTTDFGGRRMIRVQGGYVVLNFMRYRDHDHGAAERMRLLRARRRAEAEAETPPASTGTVTPNSRNSSANVRNGSANSDVGRGRGREQRAESQNPPVSPRTGVRLPEDFALTADRRRVAEAEGIDPERTFAKFCDHWRAASGANARKRDWDAAWRNWCRTEADRNRGGTRSAAPPRLTEAQRAAAIEQAWATQRERARRIGFRMPHDGEPLDSYRLKVDERVQELDSQRRQRGPAPVAQLLRAPGGAA